LAKGDLTLLGGDLRLISLRSEILFSDLDLVLIVLFSLLPDTLFSDLDLDLIRFFPLWSDILFSDLDLVLNFPKLLRFLDLDLDLGLFTLITKFLSFLANGTMLAFLLWSLEGDLFLLVAKFSLGAI